MTVLPTDDGVVAFSQSARAFLAFQLADHWGNRTTPRPRPRADVLAAVMLQTCGWNGADEPPQRAHTVLQEALDPLPDSDHEAAWRAAVASVAARGRYVEYLVSHQVSHLATVCACSSHHGFLAEQAARRECLISSLRNDPRYGDVLRGTADATNRFIVRVCDAVAARLATGAADEVAIAAMPQLGVSVPLSMNPIGDLTYRLRPWPFAGHRLRVHAEGRFVSTAHLADEAALRRAYEAGKPRQMAWTLLSAGTPAD